MSIYRENITIVSIYGLGGGSRWWRSRTWSSPSPTKNIENTFTSGTIHTEQLLNANRRPQTSENKRKLPHNQVRKKEKGIRMGPTPE